MNYRSAGVDIAKNDRLVAKIKQMMGKHGDRLGHFGGAVPFPVGEYRDPLLVTSMDGVGTKTMVAVAMAKFDTIGHDLVHHSINDIACCGAEPLAFLDYYAAGRLDVDTAARIISGIVEACERWGIALVGGETAEMPGIYSEGGIDLVGSIVGVVERDEYVDGRGITPGDVIIGFPSNGLHTNGYSLARKIAATCDNGYLTALPETGYTIGEALLKVHRCYLDEIRTLKRTVQVKGLAHITGGGLPGNVARILPEGTRARFNWGNWREPPIFDFIRRRGGVSEPDMRATFNLGVGLAAVLSSEDAETVCNRFSKGLHRPFRIGEVTGKD